MMKPTRTIAALIVAAGRGSRAGDGLPKQYRRVGQSPLLAHSVAIFAGHPAISTVRVVIDPADQQLYRESVAQAATLGAPVPGGPTRQASVRAGLEALAADAPDLVLVHDAARPFVSFDLIDRALAALSVPGSLAAVPGTALVDTIKSVDAAETVTGTPARLALRAIQTPQAFDFAALLAAHRRVAGEPGFAATDDAAVMEWAGHPVRVFPGDPANVKLTYPADFAAAERLMTRTIAMNDVRIGQGYDVHAFGPGDHVWLGGVRIAHDRGVIAHSDGDVVLHALTDALLGAIADGDIGSHFPPSDPQWRGASSDRFLAHAGALIAARGGRIGNIDITVVCEAPKVGPHRDAMRARIGAILGLEAERVAIKATTSEQMGFVGRREGLAALAVATVRLPGD
ncbi:bifunctional 2-C-methyl-D-erythritol 4-phosphate cytidylyltransferase/2-C-methyl-D-erythritol 2,4-cyclodiphosphate synthase [Phreatobacter stygius]|uniref:Bifunctional enzyme IspD/IspF n=1 Tax=Phreatobacter stygius TaxID=1940610 RepID=A0A4D7B3L4_9HYPH|nr:bifunctional 2-C-methyl-D-erythritol 4-phosphate cytidylyltransferase/2-C-methyl-D-erythritol 2,4-cyclodiphosphate synthase [Phreatobacter stygius]QCI68369.1 bifunctional 2-C-methyl-D-erythritol 4-phosphate cytidylyltransferase/2-C-methyl-D-erythritol 2,4-cyclodiphosphate synthase [Phreatobacter stygius]